MKKAIDEDQLDILTFLVSHPKRFAYIIDLLIDFNGHYFNLVSSFLSLSSMIEGKNLSFSFVVRIFDHSEEERSCSIVYQCSNSDRRI